MNVVTKSVEAQVSEVKSDNPNGEFRVILSTDALDRDGERLYSDEWKTPLPDHITFDSDHGMSVATTVGSGKPFINEKGQLEVHGTFASTNHAQTVRTLVTEGHINRTSVAFRQNKNRKDGNVVRELLNGAFVALPANDEAVVLSSKAAKSDAPVSHEQNIHDSAVALGAMCDGVKSIGDAETKAALLDDEGIDPNKVLAGIDAILDQAQALVLDVDREALPPEVTQALDMLFGVGPTVDELLEALGVYDPDETEETSGSDAGEPTDSTEKSTAPTAVKAADAADDSAGVAAQLRARSLAFLVKKTSEL